MVPSDDGESLVSVNPMSLFLDDTGKDLLASSLTATTALSLSSWLATFWIIKKERRLRLKEDYIAEKEVADPGLILHASGCPAVSTHGTLPFLYQCLSSSAMKFTFTWQPTLEQYSLNIMLYTILDITIKCI